jgi:hypothetical protein
MPEGLTQPARLPPLFNMPQMPPQAADFCQALARFSFDGTSTATFEDAGLRYFVNAFWTARQRDGHSLHEVSYRACFKPQLPEFFIARLTEPGQTVYDPFAGRGTTAVQAALMGRRPVGNDVNPLSAMLVAPRLDPPSLAAIATRLAEIGLHRSADAASRPAVPPAPDMPRDSATVRPASPPHPIITEDPVTADPPDAGRQGPAEPDLSVFYHPQTLHQILALRTWLLAREAAGDLDPVDRWIRMVAINRLTGHSPGFFSVYTMPPNQAVSVESQRKINAVRRQTPPPRDVAAIILKKSRSLLADGLPPPHPAALLTTGPAHAAALADGSVDLLVTSPPFLNVVDYQGDNWLRGWFAGIDPATVRIDSHRSIPDWERFVRRSFEAFARALRPHAFVAFEVGEVRRGSVLLERHVTAALAGLPFQVLGVMVNQQDFTKTANCWGIGNNRRGTNTNRIVLLQRLA